MITWHQIPSLTELPELKETLDEYGAQAEDIPSEFCFMFFEPVKDRVQKALRGIFGENAAIPEGNDWYGGLIVNSTPKDHTSMLPEEIDTQWLFEVNTENFGRVYVTKMAMALAAGMVVLPENHPDHAFNMTDVPKAEPAEA